MVPTNMDALEWLRKRLEDDGSDVLRQMIRAFVDALMSAEADGLCGARYGQRSDQRVDEAQRIPASSARHSGWHDQPGDPEAASRQLLSGDGWWSHDGGPSRR